MQLMLPPHLGYVSWYLGISIRHNSDKMCYSRANGVETLDNPTVNVRIGRLH